MSLLAIAHVILSTNIFSSVVPTHFPQKNFHRFGISETFMQSDDDLRRCCWYGFQTTQNNTDTVLGRVLDIFTPFPFSAVGKFVRHTGTGLLLVRLISLSTQRFRTVHAPFLFSSSSSFSCAISHHYDSWSHLAIYADVNTWYCL